MERMYRIRIMGSFNPYNRGESETLEQRAISQIADMLRYDSGVVESIEVSGVRNNQLTAVIACAGFTPRRWESFGFYTEEIESWKVKETEWGMFAREATQAAKKILERSD